MSAFPNWRPSWNDPDPERQPSKEPSETFDAAVADVDASGCQLWTRFTHRGREYEFRLIDGLVQCPGSDCPDFRADLKPCCRVLRTSQLDLFQ